jgi:hypothetical protein
MEELVFLPCRLAEEDRVAASQVEILAYLAAPSGAPQGETAGPRSLDPRVQVGTWEDVQGDARGTDNEEALQEEAEGTANAVDASRKRELGYGHPMVPVVYHMEAYTVVAYHVVAHKVEEALDTWGETACFDGRPCTCSSAGQ